MMEMQNKLDHKELENQDIKKKHKALENLVKDLQKCNGVIEERFAVIKQQHETVLNESIAAFETSLRVPDNETFSCTKCNFTTESERGLKVHVKRKHVNFEDKEFPKVCDFCDLECYNKQRMEEHLKEHSYTNLKFKCEDCDFLAEDKLTLEVHAGKSHSGNFECGLCGFIAADLDNLETHLHTCERYICKDCHPNITFSNIPDLKSHLSTKHPKHLRNTNINHIKMDRKNSEMVSSKTFMAAYFFSR